MENVGLMVALAGAMTKAPTAEQVATAVDAWLDDHPEATTTVTDGSITNAKLASSFVTPGTAAAYSSSATYAVGDYVFYGGTLYRCNTAITTAEAWTAAHWTAAVLGDDVADLKSELNGEVVPAFISGNAYKSSNGNMVFVAASNRCRLQYDVPVFKYIKADAGYQVNFFVCTLSGTTYTYVYNETWDTEWDISKYMSYAIVFVVRKINDGNITASEAKEHVHFYTEPLRKVNYAFETYNELSDMSNYKGISVPLDDWMLGWAYSGSVNANYGYTANAKRMSNPSPMRIGNGMIHINVDTGYRISYRTVSGANNNNTVIADSGWITQSGIYPVMEGYRYAFTASKANDADTTKDELLSHISITYENPMMLVGKAYSPFNIKAVNHRGYNTVAPENTLPAFKLSRMMGFRYVETDVRLTSDGVPVLLHDTSINRTARNEDGTAISGTVDIADITYAEALEYDFGIWKSSKYAGTKIPTLEQFCLLCKAIGLTPRIEFNSPMTDEEVTQCMGIIEGCGMLDKCEYNINWMTGVDAVLAYYKYATIVCGTTDITETVAANIENRMTDFNKIIINASYSTLTDTMIANAKAKHIPVEVYCVNDPSYSIPNYVAGVTSDSVNFTNIAFDNAI